MAKTLKYEIILYNLSMQEKADIITRIIKSAIDTTPVPYLITDEEGKIIYINPAGVKNTGYSKEELIGKKTSIFKSGKHNKEFYKKMWETILSLKFFSSRIINKKKDGSLYHAKINIQPVKIDGKLYFLSREEDLTNIIELESKLIESQKLESIALMVGELSHNFNNFLTVVIGSLELIKDEIDKQSIYHQLITEVLKSAREEADMIKQLLVFARKSAPDQKKSDINKLLLEIKPLIKAQITEKIRLKYDLSNDIKPVSIDEQQIKQALFNITANARDAIGENGIITIKTYNYRCLNEYLEPYHNGNYVVIEVLDNGKGIPEEALMHIFEPFFTTKPKGKGTGLGLSSTYGIIKNHNGYIYASNRKDTHGASFRIYLPALS